MNQFADLTTKEFADKLTGLKLRSQNAFESPQKETQKLKATQAPKRFIKKSLPTDSVDWRDVAVTPVRLQVEVYESLKSIFRTLFIVGKMWKLLGFLQRGSHRRTDVHEVKSVNSTLASELDRLRSYR